MLFLFPALIFILLFGMALAYSRFHSAKGEEKEKCLYYTFPENLKDKQSPVPLVLILIIVGTVIWGFLYVFISGLMGRKI